MIAYTEIRLVLQREMGESVEYVPTKDDPDIGQVYLRKTIFDGPVPQEIILTITPA